MVCARAPFYRFSYIFCAACAKHIACWLPATLLTTLLSVLSSHTLIYLCSFTIYLLQRGAAILVCTFYLIFFYLFFGLTSIKLRLSWQYALVERFPAFALAWAHALLSLLVHIWMAYHCRCCISLLGICVRFVCQENRKHKFASSTINWRLLHFCAIFSLTFATTYIRVDVFVVIKGSLFSNV